MSIIVGSGLAPFKFLGDLMNKSGTKRFLSWWFMAFVGFIGVRLSLGQSLDAIDVMGGLFTQLILVGLASVVWVLVKRGRWPSKN